MSSERDLASADTIDLGALLRWTLDALREQGRLIGLVTASGFVLCTIYAVFIATLWFKVDMVFLPELYKSPSLGGSLSDLAGLAGLDAGSKSGSVSTTIYPTILGSETVMTQVIYTKYKSEKHKDSLNLVEYFDMDGKTEREKLIDLMERLTKEKHIISLLDSKTKNLTVTVEMPEASLSAQVATALKLSLDDYLKTKRKSSAGSQREFIAARQNEVRDSLRLAEEALKTFREQNRIVSSSPELLLQQGRLQRGVELFQAVFIELQKQYELARIEEIKDTPVVNLLDDPQPPVRKSRPSRLLIVVVGTLLSAIGTSIAVLLWKKFGTAILPLIPFIKK
jgi:uncharacterized protein involved in exopolysaccharide biosynthesis